MTLKRRLNDVMAAFLAICFLLSAGCSGAPVVSDQQLAQLKAQNMARVLGRNSGALSFMEISSDFDISVLRLDGAEIEDHAFKTQALDIPAGHHAMVVKCTPAVTAATGGGVSSQTDLETDLAAGHVYQLNPAANGEGACKGVLVDISDHLRP